LHTGEKQDVVKKQLKVQKKERKIAASTGSLKKKKLKGIRLRKGVRVKVKKALPCHVVILRYILINNKVCKRLRTLN
jgi:hypothetical protein